jgi:hypothetical protein
VYLVATKFHLKLRQQVSEYQRASEVARQLTAGLKELLDDWLAAHRCEGFSVEDGLRWYRVEEDRWEREMDKSERGQLADFSAAASRSSGMLPDHIYAIVDEREGIPAASGVVEGG